VFEKDTHPEEKAAMKAFEFEEFQGSNAVSSAVTVLVAAWFVLAGGAILTDQHSEGTLEMARTPSLTSVTPDAHFSITVEARRSTAG
jgi:hypothetical protein